MEIHFSVPKQNSSRLFMAASRYLHAFYGLSASKRPELTFSPKPLVLLGSPPSYRRRTSTQNSSKEQENNRDKLETRKVRVVGQGRLTFGNPRKFRQSCKRKDERDLSVGLLLRALAPFQEVPLACHAGGAAEAANSGTIRTLANAPVLYSRCESGSHGRSRKNAASNSQPRGRRKRTAEEFHRPKFFTVTDNI